jgi:hypothetical protein
MCDLVMEKDKKIVDELRPEYIFSEQKDEYIELACVSQF